MVLTKGILLALFAVPFAASAATVTPLRDGWRLQSACVAKADGATISAPGFATRDWLKTSVPSTVFAAQTADNVYPDPYFGMNLRNVPGVSYPIGANFSNLPMPGDSPYRCGWWYRTEFKASADASHDQRLWLHFGGINYRGDIWVNGQRIADETTVAGAYRTYDFDVTDFVKSGETNVLAVETFAPSEKNLGINWVDWNPCPPDKDMGLWGNVDLVQTGPVTLRSPLAVTHFTDESLSAADLTVYAELRNATAHSVRGVVQGTAAGVHFEEPVELAPNEDREVIFTPEQFPQLHIRNPMPWWPYQMGEPHLEHLDMKFVGHDGTADEQDVEFGFREMTSELTVTGARLFRINGKPLLIRGAGWSQDMLLRTNERRLQDQFRMVRDMHLNTIRLEGKLETEEFFHLADEQGILVMLGWCCCDHWEHWSSWTAEDLTIATASLRAQLLRLRHHASLLVWLNGSDNAPPANVESAYLKVEAEMHWPNPILASASSTVTINSGLSGVKMSGPYDYVEPSYWSVDQHYGGGFGFNTETSPGPAIPSLASRKKFLTDPDAWPPTADWSFHNGGGKFTNLKVFDDAMAAIYSAPHSAAEYERMAETMEYDSERAMFEAYSKNKYVSTGIIQWMLNNAWPSMIWHLYDYYLDPGAGYYGTKKACEPLHVQYAYDDRSVVVVNSTYHAAEGLHVKVDVHGLGWRPLYSAEATVNASSDSSIRVLTLPDSLYIGPERIFFIDLMLSDAAGRRISRNFYWVPGTLTSFDWEATQYTNTPPLRYEDLSALTHLPLAELQSSAEIAEKPHGREIRVHLENTSKELAFQIHGEVQTASGELVAPVLWSDNWIELTPGEDTTLAAEIPDDVTDALTVKIESWNVQPVTLTPKTAAAAH